MLYLLIYIIFKKKKKEFRRDISILSWWWFNKKNETSTSQMIQKSNSTHIVIKYIYIYTNYEFIFISWNYIYIYICIYEVHTVSLQTFIVGYLKLSYTLENAICYCYTYYEMKDSFLWFQVQMKSRNWNNLTKAWLSLLMNFKNTIWHFRRTICSKIMF